jgi:hypothetical protein
VSLPSKINSIPARNRVCMSATSQNRSRIRSRYIARSLGSKKCPRHLLSFATLYADRYCSKDFRILYSMSMARSFSLCISASCGQRPARENAAICERR